MSLPLGVVIKRIEQLLIKAKGLITDLRGYD